MNNPGKACAYCRVYTLTIAEECPRCGTAYQKEDVMVSVEMGFVDCLNVTTHPTLEAAQDYVRRVRHQIVREALIVDTAYANGETGTITLTVDEFLGTLRVSNMMTTYAGDGIGAVAYVSPDQHPEKFRHSFDSVRFISLCKAAIKAIEGGDGIEAMKNCGEAWFRLASYHRG